MAASEEVNVIALVENLELAVPRRLPARFSTSVVRVPSTTTITTTAAGAATVPRVLEIVDRDVKLAVRRQLGVTADAADRTATKSNGSNVCEEHESLEILRRLPPGTVLIKQVEATDPPRIERQNKPATVDPRDDRPRKLSQRIRNKKPLEVLRRNPLRSVSRKDLGTVGKENRATSTRQRLLAGKRRATASVSSNDDQMVMTGVKRTRGTSAAAAAAAAAAYMSTRSVTRKLCNVGAMYDAPTWRDLAEWKEWPVHGMHERPVYHTQFGLAAEYNGRLFASFDGSAYREITAEAQHIEVVRVDPRVDSLDRSLNNPVATAGPSTSIAPTAASAATAAAADFMRQQNLMAVRQKLAVTTTPKRVDRPRVPSLSGLGSRLSALEHLQTTLGLAHRQQPQPQPHPHLEQLRSLERLHQLEVLQRRLGPPRVHHFQPTVDRYTTASRLLSQEAFLKQQQQQQQQQQNKCLIVPRNATTPTSVFLHGFKTKAGKLLLVRSDTPPRKPAAAGANVSIPCAPATWFPPARLAEATGMYRPTSLRQVPAQETMTVAAYRGEPEASQALDLSKKETRVDDKALALSAVEERNVPQAKATDLVHYFQNFGADESVDLLEDPKNLT